MKEQILRELRIHSSVIFDRLNIQLSDVLNSNFEELLEKSANRMVQESKVSPADLTKAKEAFTVFINKMYTFREPRTGQKSIVRFQALNESKSSICPLWPIC